MQFSEQAAEVEAHQGDSGEEEDDESAVVWVVVKVSGADEDESDDHRCRDVLAAALTLQERGGLVCRLR